MVSGHSSLGNVALPARWREYIVPGPATISTVAWKQWWRASVRPIAAQTQERNRGRNETRLLKVLPAPTDLPFPHATRVILLERTTTGRGDGKTHHIAELGVTSAPAERASAKDLLRLTRDHWDIEALHHVRHVTYREDASSVSTGQTPRIMATLRNTAISLGRHAGWKHTPDANDF
jgi:hypothetical protein